MSTPPDPLAIAAQAQVPEGITGPNSSAPQFQPQAATPVLSGSPGSKSAKNQGTTPGRPLLLDFMQKMIKPPMQAPAPGQMARPVSRLDTFESFLGNFLSAFGQGMEQSGQRGANFKGFGAAIQGPRQLTLQNQQLQNQTAVSQGEAANQQAEAQLKTAQAGLIGQSIPITLPNGQQIYLPANQAGQAYKGLGAAQVGAQSKENVANIQAQNKLDAIRLQTNILQQKGGKFIPDVDPTSGQKFYHVMNPFGQEIGRTDVSAIPSLMMRTSSTVDFKQLDDGSIVALPKTTVSGPSLPGAASSKAGGTPSGFPKTISDAQGKPLVGKGALTGTTRTMVETAPKVNQLIARMRPQLQALQQTGQLGPGASRWADFWSGRVGTDSPQFKAFKTNADLLSTLLMRMHVGARGGEMIMKHFDDMIGAGHQSLANMTATLDQIQAYANDVGKEGSLPSNYGTANQSAPNQGSPKAGNKALDPMNIR